MNIIVKRPNAAPRPISEKLLAPDILAICEFVTPGRTPSPTPITQGGFRLRCGSIYKLVTGLAIEGIVRPWQVHAVAQAPFWNEGLVILRTEVDPEIAFFVQAYGEVTITVGQGGIALEIIDRAEYSLAEASVTVEKGAALPPLGFTAQTGGERFVRGQPSDVGGQEPAGRKTTEAELTRKGADWLNEDDGKGRISGADTTTSPGASPAGAFEAAPSATGQIGSSVAMVARE